MRLIDLTGKHFGYLTVLSRAENDKHGKTRWLCRCICGKENVVAASDLTRKRYSTKSCGCMSRKLISESRKSHGMSKHPAYGVWHSMKQRCQDPNHHAYHNYGARGITVCDEWSNSFETFWQDMGPTYARGLDLDRIDNNAGYSKDNCRWVARKVNSRNKRSNTWITTPKYGRTTISELSELTGIGVTTLCYRIEHGWDGEELTIKPDFRNLKAERGGIIVRGKD